MVRVEPAEVKLLPALERLFPIFVAIFLLAVSASL
nr:MAG TPA: YvrJ protein family protein [Caudoviricetes sp.]